LADPRVEPEDDDGEKILPPRMLNLTHMRLGPAIALSRASWAITGKARRATTQSHAATNAGLPVFMPVPSTAATNPSVTS
jgi:hypothetical protein